MTFFFTTCESESESERKQTGECGCVWLALGGQKGAHVSALWQRTVQYLLGFGLGGGLVRGLDLDEALLVNAGLEGSLQQVL